MPQGPIIRLTQPTKMVLACVMAASPGDPPWGLRICQETDLGPGTVYPILERLATGGWITVKDEEGAPSGRPRRKFYAMSSTGLAGVRALEANRSRRFSWVPARAGEAT